MKKLFGCLAFITFLSNMISGVCKITAEMNLLRIQFSLYKVKTFTSIAITLYFILAGDALVIVTAAIIKQ